MFLAPQHSYMPPPQSGGRQGMPLPTPPGAASGVRTIRYSELLAYKLIKLCKGGEGLKNLFVRKAPSHVGTWVNRSCTDVAFCRLCRYRVQHFVICVIKMHGSKI